MEVALDLVRLIHYVASMVVFGSCLFRVFGSAGRSDKTLRPVVSIASFVALVSALCWLVVEAGNMAGSWSNCFNRGTLTTVLNQTAFGQVWAWHLGLGLLLLLTSRQRRWWLTALLAGICLAGLADEGHSAWIGGSAGALHLVNQAVHLLAAGAWFGGLVPLWLLVGDRGAAPAEILDGVRRFSWMGYVAVALVVASGAINTAILTQDGGLSPTTPWSMILLIKLILVATMLALALLNRLATPAPGDAGIVRLPAALRRRVGIEFIIGVLVVAAASVLGTLPPPGT